VQLKLQIADVLRNSPAIWKLHAVGLRLKSFTQPKADDKLLTLARAYRRWPSRSLERRLAPWLTAEQAAIWREKRIGWTRYRPQLTSEKLTKSLILKAPGAGGEKGVLYVSFEYNWLRLLQHFDIRRLLDEYFLVGASSWSPPDFPAHWALAQVGPDPVFMQISNPSDTDLYARFDHKIRPIPIMASDWINPDFYEPRPHNQREIDILMVAGWSHVKRHWLLFRALRKMSPRLRVALIGQDADGRTANDVLREAKAFGVADRLQMIQDASIVDVTKHQCNSKTSIILSGREGSCVVVAESLFADTPVAMMHNAHVGSRAYINAQTGVLLHADAMHTQLGELIERSVSFSPREWALANITSARTTEKLNGILRDYSRERGLPWTSDIAPMCWRPDPVYLQPADNEHMQSAYAALQGRHGVVIAGHEVERLVSSSRLQTEPR
jgi:glycosyltransferase involved in cell wall biosynthesis